MTVGYRPERDVSAELTACGVQRYQELIGVLRWAAELGCIDILIATAMLSTYMAVPRKGHLEQVYHVFRYLKTNSKRHLFFDPRHPDIDECTFSSYEKYRNAPHSYHWYVLGPWSLQSWVYQGSFLKMGRSLSWSGCLKLGLFQRKILE